MSSFNLTTRTIAEARIGTNRNLFVKIASRIGCVASTLFVLACNSPPRIVGHHELVLEVDYNGERLKLRLPFSCANYKVGMGGEYQVAAAPRPYLYKQLPDGSALAVGTPAICAGRWAETATGQTERPLDAPYTGSILIPPTAWMDDLKRPTVIKQWASAQAMRNASSGLIIRSASVAGSVAQTRSSLRDDGWSRMPGRLAGMDDDDMCGVAFVQTMSARPAGFEETPYQDVMWSTKRRNFQFDPSFGTFGIANTPAEFGGVLIAKNPRDPNALSDSISRANQIKPLSYSKQTGWHLNERSENVGFYQSYLISQRQHRKHQSFKMGGYELPLTWSRQLWLEKEAVLLTPIGFCKHWVADR